MDDTVTHQSLITAARKEIRALKCPRHVRKDVWGRLQDLLCAIAGYLPDCWPSERTLAGRLDRPQQSVHRSLCRARELGLVTTTPRALDRSRRPGQAYHLVCLSDPLKAALARHQFQTSLDVRSKSSSSKKTQTGSPSEIPLSQAPPGGLETPVTKRFDDRDEFSSPAYGEDPRAPLGEPTVLSTDPAVFLARRFDSKWSRLLLTRPDLRSIRGSSRGMAIGYLRKVMLQEKSPEHAEAYMDEFVLAVADDSVEVKEGQFAFERFTAWWGREEVEDPALARKDAEEARAARAKYREMIEGQEPIPFLDRFPPKEA